MADHFNFSSMQKMKFLIQESQGDHNFSLIYRDEDYSFDREPHDGTGFTSIMINDLQLEINDEGKIIYVWGLCPLIKYEKTAQFPTKYKEGSLVAMLDSPPIPGIFYRLNEDFRWPIYINKEKGWVCLGNPDTKNKKLIEFAPECIATLDGQDLIGIWLHPEQLPALE